MGRRLTAAVSGRRTRWFLLAAAAGVTAYLIHRHPAVARRRRRLARLVASISVLADAASSSAVAAATLSSDLSSFLRSDSDEVPRSLRQLSKLAVSGEATGSLSKVSEAVTAGIIRGCSAAAPTSPSDGPTLADRLIDKLFSRAGSDFASNLASSLARSAVLSFFLTQPAVEELSGASSATPPRWAEVLAAEPFKEAIGGWINIFVNTAVSVFIDKTIHINAYDQLFEAVTNPAHAAPAQELLISVCRTATETLVRTFHQLRFGPNLNPAANVAMNHIDDDATGSNSIHEPTSTDASVRNNGWVSMVSSTLTVPSNRNLLLDVMGRVTSESVRSLLEFTLWQLTDHVRYVGNAVADSGLKVVRLVGARSMVVVAICMTLCLLVYAGSKSSVPA